MNITKKKLIALPLLVLSAVAGSARAETLFTILKDDRTRWGIGGAILTEDEGYRGIGRETEALPLLYVATDRFRLVGPQAEYRVLGTKQTALKLRADYRFDGFEAEDGPVFSGMDQRKGSVFLGLAGLHTSTWGEVTFDWVKATSASRGVRGGVTYAYPIQLGPWTVAPKVGLEHFDRKFVAYYYGVKANEATSGRPAYTGGASLNLDVGVDLQYEINPSHTLLSSLKYRRFGSAIQDSPLIEKSGSPRFTVAYLYRF